MHDLCWSVWWTGKCSAVQILAVLDRMDLLDYDKVASYVASLQQVCLQQADSKNTKTQAPLGPCV